MTDEIVHEPQPIPALLVVFLVLLAFLLVGISAQNYKESRQPEPTPVVTQPLTGPSNGPPAKSEQAHPDKPHPPWSQPLS